jgi:dipeptidyl aminopeptidase/acylaminoacyl peptidase
MIPLVRKQCFNFAQSTAFDKKGEAHMIIRRIHSQLLSAVTVSSLSLLALLAFSFVCPQVAEATAEPSDSSSQTPGKEEAADVLLEDWLVLGPSGVGLPVFSDSTQREGRAVEVLGSTYLDFAELIPVDGGEVSWQPGRVLGWKSTALRDSVLSFSPVVHDTSMVSVAYAACYLESPRWQKIELVVGTRQRVAVYLDGEELKKKSEATDGAEQPEELTCELTLARDKHLLVIKTVSDSRDSLAEWSMRPLFRVDQKRLSHVPDASLSPVHRFSSRDMEKMKSLRDVVISPDGRWLALVVSETDVKRDKYVRFLEMFDTRSGERIHSVRMGDAISTPRWAPDSKGLVFISDSPSKGSNLWFMDMNTRGLEKVVSEEKGLGMPRWSADGQYVFFTSWFPQPEDDEGRSYEKLDELYERWSYWKNKSHLFVVSLSSKTKLQLTTGEFTVQWYELSPDGRSLAFLRSVPVAERPFFESELWRLEVETLESDTLMSERFDIEEFAWAPDGRSLAFIGECSVGIDDDVQNRYRQSLYLLDIDSGTYEKLTEDAGPSVGAELLGVRWAGKSLWWSGTRRIYFVATDKTRVRLYHLDPKAPEKVTDVKLPLTVPYHFDVSADRRYVACIGTSSSDYRKAYVVDLSKESATEILDPAADAMKHSLPARVEREDFVNSDGTAIDGWLYYPQDFDASRKYPLIVYYYGGVSAMGETFSRSAHWLAGQDYVYYILNPRGAVSYGQAFADAHVNDWGELSARDVIEGVDRLLSTKSFLDKERVGCYGGSFGGFLTMSLLTQTDVFKAALAWYGISNLASYWGAGWWGYLYSDVASALSFPWNRPDVYVDKSPLFHADRIDTPLLLLHGTSDINVPSLESDQMFAALRVLDKEVVYIRWEGEGHGISSKPSSRRDSRQIMLEWFDKHLKDQPEAWNERWKDD